MIAIKDIITDQSDQLDYPDRVIQMALGFNHLVIATVKQCFIHKLTSWNTPVTFDLKEGTISMILLAERLVVLNVIVFFFNYYTYLSLSSMTVIDFLC